jgi:hypothetical protein
MENGKEKTKDDDDDDDDEGGKGEGKATHIKKVVHTYNCKRGVS